MDAEIKASDLPNPSTGGVAELTYRLDEYEETVRKRFRGHDNRLTVLDTDVKGNDAAIKGLRRSLGAALEEATTAGAKALAATESANALEESLDTYKGAADAAALRMARMEQRLAALEASPPGQLHDDNAADADSHSEGDQSSARSAPSPELFEARGRGPAKQQGAFHLGAAEQSAPSPFSHAAPERQQVSFQTPIRRAGKDAQTSQRSHPDTGSLTTAVDHPDDGLDQPVDCFTPLTIGPFAPGLRPMRTMVHQFSTLVDYRSYRLLDMCPQISDRETRNLYDMRKKVDARYSNIRKYSGVEAIEVFSFIADFRDAMNAFRQSEAAAVPLLGHYLEGAAKRV